MDRDTEVHVDNYGEYSNTEISEITVYQFTDGSVEITIRTTREP